MRRSAAVIAWVLLVVLIALEFWRLESIDQSRAQGRTNVCTALAAISHQFTVDGHPAPAVDRAIVNLHCPKG